MATGKPGSAGPLRRLASFPLLSARGSRLAAPSEAELLYELTGENPENRLFGRFTEGDVRDLLGRSGVLEGLARKGYPDPVLAIDGRDAGDQRVHLFAGEARRERLLLEARLELRTFRPRRPTGALSVESDLRMLIIHWLLLSDPGRTFTVDRPRLPGQERPGLGLMRPCMALLGAMARELILDGVLDVPDHFHTAFIYSSRFSYLDPEVQGFFLAVARDLRGIPLALASEAVGEGCLRDRSSGDPVAWRAAEQVLPVCAALRRHFRSEAYREARDKVRASLSVAVDWDLYRAKIAGRPGFGNYS